MNRSSSWSRLCALTGGYRRCGTYAWVVVIALVAALPYLPSLGGGFVLDDNDLIIDNPVSHSLSSIPEAFTTHFLHGFVAAESLYYRPLVTVTYQADYSLSGPNPLAFRLTNLALYVVCALLVFVVALRLTGDRVAAGAAGLAFGILPSHAQSVAWISGRTDMLATILMVLSFLVFIANHRRGPAFNWVLGALCAVLFGLAMLSKESAVILPSLFGLYAMVFGRSIRRDEAIKWAALLVPTLLLYIIARHAVLGVTLGTDIPHMLEQRLLRLGIAYGAYLRMVFAPLELRVEYDSYPLKQMTLSAVALAAWLVPVGLATVSVLARRRLPVIAFAAGWIFVTLIPAAPLDPAERFVFTASVGSSLMLGWLFAKLWGYRPPAVRFAPYAAAAVGAACVLYCTELVAMNSHVYFSELCWARYVARTKPRHAIARASAALFLAEAGDLVAAKHEYEAVAGGLWEDFSREQRARLECELGLTYARLGKTDKACKAFAEAVRYRSDFARAWRYLGRANLRLGRFKQSVAAYERASALVDLDLRDVLDAAMAYKGNGNPTTAARALDYVISQNPSGPYAARARSELARLSARTR